MIKKSFYVFFIAFLGLVCFGQEICVEGKIVFHKERNYFILGNKGKQYMPYLRLIYKNKSASYYYFYKPKIIFPICLLSKYKRSNSHFDTDSGKGFIDNVHISYFYEPNISIQMKKYSKNNTYTEDTIQINVLSKNFQNYNFEKCIDYNLIGELLYSQELLNKYNTGLKFKYFHYKSKRIITIKQFPDKLFYREIYYPINIYKKGRIKKSKEFVFLNPGETFVEEVSLESFFYLKRKKILLNFTLAKPVKRIDIYPKDFTFTTDIKELSKIKEQSLPKKIGSYDLYEGTISGDSVWLDLTKK